MDGILITILIVTGFLIYKMISSSKKQEGYKRWKATDGSKEEKTTKVNAERKSKVDDNTAKMQSIKWLGV